MKALMMCAGKAADGLITNEGEYMKNGRVRKVLPWNSHEDALRAEKRLDAFMEEVHGICCALMIRSHRPR